MVPLFLDSLACLRETFRSVRRMVFPSFRPIVISSRIRGTTVVLPSSSSMMSLYMPLLRRLAFVTSVSWLVHENGETQFISVGSARQALVLRRLGPRLGGI